LAEVVQKMSASSADRTFASMEVDDVEVPYVPGDFEGASGRVHDVLEMPKTQHKCEVCAAKYAHWDHFAYCDKSGKVVVHQDSVLSQVKQKATGKGFSNLAKGSETLVLACVICCEKQMKETYTVKKGEGFTLTSAWKTLARRTKPNMKMSNKKLQNAMQTMEDHINRDGGVEGKAVDIKDVYTLTESKLARQAADWVCELALNLCILYGCCECGLYPLQSSFWWRCNSQINAADGTVTGGHWRCAGCLKRFSSGVGATRRLLAIGDESQYFYFYIGDTSTLVEAKLRFLQMCQMVTVLDGKPVTKETLLECIRILNERTQQRLSSFKEVVTLAAKDPSEMNVEIFCSDARLYLSAVGQRFKALDLRGETIEVLDEEGQNGVLDFAFGLTNWEEKWPAEPSLRKVFWNLKASQATKDSRAALRETVSKMM
jgi:hypothetical protein